jgi:hypothetical protein
MRRLFWTAAMFALTLGCVAVAAATKSVIPVFLAWLPLLALVWVLNRPDPSDAAWPESPLGAAAADQADERSEEQP